MQTLLITLPLFLLIAIGYILRKQNVLSKQTTDTLSYVVYRVSLPAAILAAFWGVDWSNPSVLQTVAFNVALLLLFGILLLLLGFVLKLKPELQAALFMAGIIGNTVYMGFPIGESAFSAEGFDLFLSAATPHIAMGIIFAELVAQKLLKRKRKSAAGYLQGVLINPLVIAFFGGILLSFLPMKYSIVSSLHGTISMVAATASPLALIGIGSFLYHHLVPLKEKVEIVAIVMKIIVFPAMVFSAGLLVPGLDKSIVTASATAAAMPTAVSTFIIAQRHRVAPKLIANTILWSTLFSIVTVTILLTFIR